MYCIITKVQNCFSSPESRLTFVWLKIQDAYFWLVMILEKLWTGLESLNYCQIMQVPGSLFWKAFCNGIIDPQKGVNSIRKAIQSMEKLLLGREMKMIYLLIIKRRLQLALQGLFQLQEPKECVLNQLVAEEFSSYFLFTSIIIKPSVLASWYCRSFYMLGQLLGLLL